MSWAYLGPRYSPNSYCTSDMAAFNVFDVVSAEHKTFPTPSGYATCYATDAGFNKKTTRNIYKAAARGMDKPCLATYLYVFSRIIHSEKERGRVV